MTKEQWLDELVGQLREDLGEDLVCAVLYGSAVTGDFQPGVSDLNVLCVLKTIGPAQLEKAYPAIDRWLKRKQPPRFFCLRKNYKTRAMLSPSSFVTSATPTACCMAKIWWRRSKSIPPIIATR